MPYDVGSDTYIDKRTGIFRNILGIKSQEELESAEARITSVEIATLINEGVPTPNEFNPNLLKAVHKQLFNEIYEWAGQLRTVELSKGTTSFARMEHLGASLEDTLSQLAKEDYLIDLEFDEFVKRLAHYYGELIILHPFREGNGRAVRTFLAMLAESIGWHIAWDEMNPDDNIAASIAAYLGDEKPMVKMLKKIVTPVDAFWGRDPYEFIDL